MKLSVFLQNPKFIISYLIMKPVFGAEGPDYLLKLFEDNIDIS